MGVYSKLKADKEYLTPHEYRFRHRAVLVILLLAILIGFGRYVYWITVRKNELGTMAVIQYKSVIVLKAERGKIYDTNGYIIAENIRKVDVGVDKNVLEISIDSTAKLLNNALGLPLNELNKLIGTSKKKYVPIARSLIVRDHPKIESLRFKGLVKDFSYTRSYPNEACAATAIGKVNGEGDGIAGIEMQLDNLMTGKDGKLFRKRIGGKSFAALADSGKQIPVNGSDIVTTIHLPIQQIVEEELEKTCLEFNSVAGYGIVMNPTNGHILAMASFPFFDPNQVNYDTLAMRTRPCYDIFEPGSTMKAMSFASVLDHTNTQISEIIPTYGGKIKIQGHLITDDHPTGPLTVEDAFSKSSNVITLQLAQRLKSETFKNYLLKFGFSQKTKVGLIEQSGNMPTSKNWSLISHCTISYGHGIDMTALQLTSAYAAIANHGKRMRPMIIKQINWSDGKVEEIEPQVVDQPISQNTAKTMLDLLERVVKLGTGKNAQIDGLRVGGKTGTARRIENGRYQKNQYVANFVGISSIDYPEYVVAVIIDNPRRGGHYAGTVAAPCWKRIVSRIHKEVPSQILYSEPVIFTGMEPSGKLIPDVVGVTLPKAKMLLNGMKVEWVGNGDFVSKQFPNLGTIESDKTIHVYLSNTPIRTDYVKVPYLVGLSLREAINKLSSNYLIPEFDGGGIVTGQEPNENSLVKVNSKVKLQVSQRTI